jgi:multisubunit Na+/H+ antiporter MnhF subunit
VIAFAYVLLSIAAILFVVRLLLGPTVADRVIALDGLLVVILGAVLVDAAWVDAGVIIDAVLVVAMLGFVATGVVARYIEQRGG